MVEYVGLVERGLECPSYLDAKKYIQEQKSLPTSCQECYTVTVWAAKEEANIDRFVEFFRAEFKAIPKDRTFQRIYFRLKNGEKIEEFIREYREKLKNQGIEAKIDWARCCGRIRKEFPSFFRGAKELSQGKQLKLFE